MVTFICVVLQCCNATNIKKSIIKIFYLWCLCMCLILIGCCCHALYCTAFWQTCFNYQLNAQFLYSITICMLHYNPRHVSSSTMLIFRRSNCIITSSGIVTLSKRLYSMPVESVLSPLSTRRTVQELCIKLVIGTSLYYDARSEKHQSCDSVRSAWFK